MLLAAMCLVGCGAAETKDVAYYYPDGLDNSMSFELQMYADASESEGGSSASIEEASDSINDGGESSEGDSADSINNSINQNNQIQDNPGNNEQRDPNEDIGNNNQQIEEIMNPVIDNPEQQISVPVKGKWDDLIALYKDGQISYDQLVYAGMTVQELYSAGLVSLQDMLNAGLISEEGIREAGLTLDNPSEQPVIENNQDYPSEQKISENNQENKVINENNVGQENELENDSEIEGMPRDE